MKPFGALSIQSSLARDGHIGTMGGIDERRVIPNFRPFKSGQYQRQIVIGIGAKENGGILLYLDLNVGSQVKGASGKINTPGRNHDTSTSPLKTIWKSIAKQFNTLKLLATIELQNT